MNELTFKVEENGNLKEYKIIKYLSNPNTDKTYIIYHDLDNEDETYASAYHVNKGQIILDPVETDSEWDFLDDALNMEE